MCTKNHNHMRYGSWDTKWDRQIFFLSFWAIFFPFTPKTTHKIKILKKWKKHLGMSTSYTYVQQITIKWCMLSETWSTTDRFFVTLDYFLPSYPPNNPENHNFEKLKKNAWRYHHFTHLHHKWKSCDVCSWDKERNSQTKFFVSLGHFLPFNPTNNPEN